MSKEEISGISDASESVAVKDGASLSTTSNSLVLNQEAGAPTSSAPKVIPTSRIVTRGVLALKNLQDLSVPREFPSIDDVLMGFTSNTPDDVLMAAFPPRSGSKGKEKESAEALASIDDLLLGTVTSKNGQAKGKEVQGNTEKEAAKDETAAVLAQVTGLSVPGNEGSWILSQKLPRQMTFAEEYDLFVAACKAGVVEAT